MSSFLKKLRIFLVLFFSLFVFSTQSFATVRLALVGGGVLTTPRDELKRSYQAEPGLGGGLLIEPLLGEKEIIGFETGVLYLQRKFSLTQKNALTQVEQKVSWSMQTAMIPLLFKLHAGRYLTFGLGGYLTYSFGKVKTSSLTTRNGAVISVVDNGYSYTEEGLRHYEGGGLASLTAHIPLGYKKDSSPTGPRKFFIVDLRYAYGGLNQARDKGDTFKYTDLMAFVGFQFSVGSAPMERGNI